MRNPYFVLGAPEGSSMDRINEAYRRLAAEYSASGNNAKLDELNEAYDSIVMNSAQGSYSYVGSDFSDIRAKIDQGRLEDAQILLDGIPSGERNAEWYYLKATVYRRKGWLDQAADYYAKACKADPGNSTYRDAYNSAADERNGGYRTNRSRSSNSGCSGCDICTGLICADCCCESMGGDLIPCC